MSTILDTFGVHTIIITGLSGYDAYGPTEEESRTVEGVWVCEKPQKVLSKEGEETTVAATVIAPLDLDVTPGDKVMLPSGYEGKIVAITLGDTGGLIGELEHKTLAIL